VIALIALIAFLGLIAVVVVVLVNQTHQTGVHYQQVVATDVQAAIGQLQQIIHQYAKK
jgi:hypothetical protein